MVSVFISYAREDTAFVTHLVRGLTDAGQQPRWDQDNRSIAFSAPWRGEIDSAIRESEKFVFVISPDSLRSAPCLSELAIARSLSKQVVPLMHRRPAGDQDVESGLGELNWIFFERPDQFALGLHHLVEVLQTDLGWVRQHSRLAVRAEEWSVGDADRSKLLRGSDLREAERWLEQGDEHPLTPPTPLQRRFVAESRRASDRGSRRLRAALATGLVIAVALAAFAWVQRNDARHQATVARARELAARASAELSTNPQSSLELAEQSVTMSKSAAGTSVLRLAVAADSLRERLRPGAGADQVAVWSPSGEVLAANGADNRVQFWNARTGRLIRTVGSLPAADRITQLLYSPDGRYLAAVASHGRIEIYAASTGAALATSRANTVLDADALRHDPPPHGTNVASGVQAVWSPRGDVLALYGAVLAHPVLTSAATGEAIALRTAAPVSAMAFGPTGLQAVLLFAGTDPAVARPAVIENLTSAATVPLDPDVTSGWDGDSHLVCWTPDGTEIATWNPIEAQDNVVRLFAPHTGHELYEQAPGVTTSVAACGVNDTGPYVATGTYPGDAYLLRTSTVDNKQRIDTVAMFGHTQLVEAVTTTADGNYIATASDDGTVRVWNAATGALVSVQRAAGAVRQVGFAPGGGVVFAVETNGTVDIFDAGIGEPAVRLDAPAGGYAHAVGFLDGERLVYGFHEATKGGSRFVAPTVTALSVLVWDAASGRIRSNFTLPDLPALPTPSDCDRYFPPCRPDTYAAELALVRVSSDGTQLAFASPGGVTVRDLEAGTEQMVPVAGGVTFVGFSESLHRLVAIGPRRLVSTDVSTGQIATADISGYPLAAELSADGRRLVTTSASVTTVWDAATATPMAKLAAPRPAGKGAVAAPLLRVASNTDASTIAIGDGNGVVQLWHPDQPRAFATRDLARDTGSASATQYPTAELRFVDGDSQVLGVNYPQIEAGDSNPPGAGFLLDAATGTVTAKFASPGQVAAAWEPGVAVSTDGQFLLGGVEGFAPVGQVAGRDGVYTLGGAHQLLDLQGPIDTASAAAANPLATSDDWSADSTRLIAGPAAIYACDACADLADLQRTARLRKAWTAPLTPTADVPPGDNAFF